MKDYNPLHLIMVFAGIASFFLPFYDALGGIGFDLGGFGESSGYDFLSNIFQLLRTLSTPVGSFGMSMGSHIPPEKIFIGIMILVFIISGPFSVLFKSINICITLIKGEVYRGKFIYFYGFTVLISLAGIIMGEKLNSPYMFISMLGPAFWIGLAFYITGSIVRSKILMAEEENFKNIPKVTVDDVDIPISEDRPHLNEIKTSSRAHNFSLKLQNNEEMAILIMIFIEMNWYKYKPKSKKELIIYLQDSILNDERIKHLFKNLKFLKANNFFNELEIILTGKDKSENIDNIKSLLEKYELIE